MPQLSRRRLLAASVPALGGAAAALHSAVPHSHPWHAEAQAAEAGHEHGGDAGHEGHASFRDGRTVDHRATSACRRPSGGGRGAATACPRWLPKAPRFAAMAGSGDPAERERARHALARMPALAQLLDWATLRALGRAER